jgi:hypothetical protein
MPSGISGIFAVTSVGNGEGWLAVYSWPGQVIVLVMCGPLFHLLMDVVGCAKGLR